MTAGRRCRPRGWSSKGVWGRWWRASTGSRKKGDAAGTDAVTVVAGGRPDGDGDAVGAGRGGLRLGLPGRGDPGERSGPPRRGGEGELPWPAGCDGAARRAGRGPERGVGELPEGDAELLAGPVPLLRRARSAADGQRPGAAVRLASVSRAAVERAEGGVAGAGGAGVGAAAGDAGDAVARRQQGRGPGAVGPERLAGCARRSGAAPGGAGAGPAVPPRPGRLSPKS